MYAKRPSRGVGLGVARVWATEEDGPGLAMSRSLGDYQAHSLGVSAKPQLIDYMIELTDEAIVIATDGVWQYLENE